MHEAMLASVAHPIWLADHEGIVRFANTAALDLLGYEDPSAVRGKRSHDVIQARHADYSSFPVDDSAMARTLRTGEVTLVSDDWFIRSDASMIRVAHSWAAVELVGGRGAVCSFNAIAAAGGVPPAAHERDVAAARADEGRAAQRRIIAAADGARRRVARDLHDGAQQRILMVVMNLQLAQQRWEDPVKARAHVDAASEHAERARDELRDFVAGTHPQVLTDLGLADAVDALARRMPVPVSVDLGDRRLPSAVEASLYFFASEALTNVLKHSEASRAAVRLEFGKRTVILEVCDDGVGGARPAPGSGLSGLADRIGALDGELSVTSEPGNGTTLRAELPWDSAGAA